MVVTVRVRVALGVDRLSQMVAQELAVHVPGRELRRGRRSWWKNDLL